MTVPEAARTHQEERARLATLAARSATAMWDRIDPDLIAQSWGTLVPAATAATSVAQRVAAQAADTYLDTVAPGLPSAGRIAPAAYAGVASDGRPLETLLLTPISPVLSAIATGNPVPLALASGRLMLELLVRTMVADAGRAADTTAMAARRDITGYVRVVEVGACARCIVLAGREYKFDAGFLRHPRCQCTQAPLFHSNRLTRAITPSDPQEIFESLSPAEQDRVFGQAGAEAIRSGADIDQVVNARRGMNTAIVHGRSVRVTTESTTARGVAARRMGAPGATRLMPEQILADAEDREDAIRLLRRFGYLAGIDVDDRREDERTVELARPAPDREPDADTDLEAAPDRDAADQQEQEVTEEASARPEPEVEPEPTPAPEPPRETLADLVPDFSKERFLDEDAARRFLRENVAGTYAGYEVVLADVSGNQFLQADFTIRDANGVVVGISTRRFQVDDDGDLVATHVLLDLREQVEGQGFASAFNAHLEDNVYRPAGFDRIATHADIDVGGYAWARAGYDWSPTHPAHAERCLDRLEAELARLRDAPGDDRTAAEIEAAEALLDRARRAEFGDEDYPTPYELSQVGRQPGDAGRDATWIGKRAMLGSDWQGVKWL